MIITDNTMSTLLWSGMILQSRLKWTLQLKRLLMVGKNIFLKSILSICCCYQSLQVHLAKPLANCVCKLQFPLCSTLCLFCLLFYVSFHRNVMPCACVVVQVDSVPFRQGLMHLCISHYNPALLFYYPANSNHPLCYTLKGSMNGTKKFL